MTGSRTRVALLLLLTFAAGAAAGVAADRLSLLPGTARAEEAETAGGKEKERSRTTIERFADELGLTADQRGRIEEVLAGFRGEVKALRKEFHPRWAALVDSAQARIEAVLTPEQVEQYRALLERERRERRRDAGGHGSGKRDGPSSPDGEADGSGSDRDASGPRGGAPAAGREEGA